MVTKHITNIPSSKHSGKRRVTQMLVVHSAECPLQRGYAQSLTEWANGPGVQASWNAFAGPETLVRAVHTDYAAWHASWANTLSVGYETTGYAAYNRNTWLTDPDGLALIERLAMEMAEDARIYNIPLRWLTGEQVNQIRAGNRGIKGLASHRQIDPANRTDPGNGFPYDYLLERIKHHSGVRTVAAGNITPIEQPTNTSQEDDMLLFRWGRSRGRILSGGEFRGCAASLIDKLEKAGYPVIQLTDAEHAELVKNFNSTPDLVEIDE